MPNGLYPNIDTTLQILTYPFPIFADSLIAIHLVFKQLERRKNPEGTDKDS